MKNYIYHNNLVGKKQLRQLLAWSFSNYDSMQSCSLADELKYLGFRYASQAGISISIEDLRGDGDHYSATVISKSFEGKSKIEQHKMVYDSLKGKMGNELHALMLKTKTE